MLASSWAVQLQLQLSVSILRLVLPSAGPIGFCVLSCHLPKIHLNINI